MKNFAVFFLTLALICSQSDAMAQIKVDMKKKVEREANKRANKRADKAVNDTFDAVEDEIDGKNKKTEEEKTTDKSESKSKSGGKSEEQSNESPTNAGNTPGAESNVNEQETEKPVLNWAKYDFVPGTEIIFEDNQEGELNGEFPSKWDLVKGSVENANFDGSNVIYFIKCNANSGGNIIPLLTNSSEDYLPEEFTIEFDAFFGENSTNYYVTLADMKNQIKLDNTMRADEKWVRFGKNGAAHKQDIEIKNYPGFGSGKVDRTTKWRHIAISFNKRALKAYLDDVRLINIPNLGYNPTGITLGYHNPGGTTVGYIKNIRIAKGAVPLYDKFLTDGKFVTTGIKFDVNKATIKPESLGTINYVAKMMTDHPELKFSVEGHTDSDGDNALNQTLSEARAKAVVEALVKSGISADRLSSKGFGETKPMAGNETTEGKAQNRRVEFVKI